MAQPTSDLLKLLAANPLPAAARAYLVIGREPANSNEVHAISLVILVGDVIHYVSDSDTYIERGGRESRLVSTLASLFALGFKAPSVLVEKTEMIDRLSAGLRPVFTVSLSGLADNGRTAEARYWPDMEAAYNAAYRRAREDHEQATAAGNLPK
ncbi:hypothetical protein [Paraburkholderia youngii]|uniref:hypothetical protein n=1 Tax=Paraburkholderia youngii TaxID=2782701 RepID=UPI003D19BBBF